MPKQIIIAEQHRTAAVFSEDQIQELIVATGSHQVGDIYLGTVENVLPGIDAAFVNLGDSERNGFMHVSDLGPLKLKRMAASITELLAPQQKVLVQVMKEPTGNKGPRLTGKVTLPGRYLVLMPYGRGVNLSRRIRNDAERHRLRALGILVKPPGMGLLVRTEAEGVSEEAIIEDLEALQKRWELIQQEALTTRAPSLLNRDDDFIQRVLRDVYSADVNRIVTDSHTGLQRVKQHLSNWNAGRIPPGVLIDHHRGETHILEFFRVNAAIREALKPRVDLPSGGYIIIEPTEALTVIDVNSGSFTRSATARETVLWTNCEAAAEIARQLRLRNVAGVIIVDFIDMDARRDQMQVLEHFSKALRADKARPQISQLSELGLVELTRKRQGQNIYELFGRPCSTCGGLGHIVHLPGEAPAIEPERSIVAMREPTPATAVPFPARFSSPREARPEPFEPFQDLQALDLLHHPDYQEKGATRGGSSNNRRRRRRGPEPAPSRSLRVNTPPPKEIIEEAEPYVKPPLPVETTEPAQTRNRRSRNGRSRKPEVPPELVSVEMTLEEQKVYAAMGISPLILSQQPVKDPRNTLVSVVLPGEGETLLAASRPVIGDTADEFEDDFSDDMADLDFTPEKFIPERFAPEKFTPERFASEKLTPEKPIPGRLTPEKVVAEKFTPEREVAAVNPTLPDDTTDAEEDLADSRRRRRRRSSANFASGE